jgi:predicted O-linked N-acetylglucosamine transferase (SPINDLY family)
VNLGANHHALEQFVEAERYYREAVRLDPQCATARNALGSSLLSQGRNEEALAEFRAAMRLDPEDALNHIHASAALQQEGKMDAALASLDEALRLDPNNADAYNNIAMIRNEQGRRDEAEAAARRAIELRPDLTQAHNNLGVAVMALGRMEEAIASTREAARLDPTRSLHHSNLIYMLNYVSKYDAATVFAEHLEWGRRHADPLTAVAAPHALDRSPHRRLKVGYVSGHFMDHAVNFFTEPILASHDHANFEVFCYAHVPRPDDVTARLRPYADHWRDIAYLPDPQAADLIRQDQIDILVDLTGHIGGTRLLIFARKPAPIQVTYIGYQNTTGMRAMDYRLTDAWADPPGTTDAYYTEKLVRLPRAFFCYLPSANAPPVAPLPARSQGHITFGSFNAFPKVTPQVLATWAELLGRVPDSRLVIVADATPSLVEYLNRTWTEHELDPQRVTLADRRPRLDYLRLIDRVDIALDPFPFNGHTTTCDALWQGVPVVTLAGDQYVSRFGSSAHVNLGLEDLIARSPQQYVDVAARLAGDLPRLERLRGSLRDRMAASPLLDFVGFTRNLEAAYRHMWIDWCAASGDKAAG